MKLKDGICPRCDSKRTRKEKIMGADTMDIECLDCGHIGHWREFHPTEVKDEER